MPDVPILKPPCDRADATAVLKRLREAGHVAYFAGGCVRDLLMGLQPKDYDVATDAPPQRVRQLFSNTQAVGQAFGVILVRHRRSVVEVATFRSEGVYLDGRRPSEVHFTTAEEDAGRRDFTINGLFLDPLDDDRVIDYVGGLKDLAERRLRAIGDPAHRFAEDHLRLLRAVRFASRFDLQIDPATADAILAAAPLLRHISPERIADELRLMITPPTRAAAWPMLWKFRLMHVILRFLPLPEQATLDLDRSIFLAVAPGEAIPFGLALAAGNLCALHQLGEPISSLLQRSRIRHMVRAMRQGLKISNDESEMMEGTLEGLEILLREATPGVAALKRFLARPTAGQSRALHRAVDADSDVARELRRRLEDLEKTDFAPAPLITGDDLTAAGMMPGPAFKRILDVVYDAQLEGRIATREEAMTMAQSIARS